MMEMICFEGEKYLEVVQVVDIVLDTWLFV
jgi:hypothetical protein